MKLVNVTLLVLGVLVFGAVRVLADPQGTGFTYQGQLSKNSALINGTINLRFTLFDAVSGGSQVGSQQFVSSVPVSNGLFTVTLDFGAGIFAGNARWLEIAVQGSGDPGYTTLTPLQAVNGTPYALRALAPWSSSGNNISFDSGNVGIGVSNPVTRLEVNGDWTGEEGALRLTGDKPSMTLQGGTASANKKWLMHVGADGPGNLEFFYKGLAGWIPLISMHGPAFGASSVGIGTTSPQSGKLHVVSSGFLPAGYFVNSTGDVSLKAEGRAQVDVLEILGGSDLAEPFDVSTSREGEKIAPGMVVAIDPDRPGGLKVADTPYDTRLAGVVSGAKGLAPGMVMRSEGNPHGDGDHPVALAGRVWCWADATYGAITPGDLLTSSGTPGMAMRVSDPAQSSGTILGKAMSALSEGRGLVLVLVTLQ